MLHIARATRGGAAAAARLQQQHGAAAAIGGARAASTKLGSAGDGIKPGTAERPWYVQPADTNVNPKQTDAVALSSGTSGRSVEFNRPKALNALNLEMIDALTPMAQNWELFRAQAADRLSAKLPGNQVLGADPDGNLSHKGEHRMGMADDRAVESYATVVDAAPVGVVFHGAGGKAFCAGGDILALYHNGRSPHKRHKAVEFFAREYRLNHVLGTTDTPVISVLNGITMGGGVGLSVHGQVRVATEKTLFAMPETGIGFLPDVGGGYFLPRLAHPGLGMYLALTGARLRGAEALAAGVATRYMPVERLSALCSAVRNELPRGVAGSRDASRKAVDHLLDDFCEVPPPEAAATLTDRLAAIDRCFGDDAASVEDCVGRLAREAAGAPSGSAADADWARATLGMLARASPQALKVTFEQLRRGGGRHGGSDGADLGSVLKMEFRVAARFMEAELGSDFFEGVRALLVDKDNAPKWKHAPDSLRALAAADAEPAALAAGLEDTLARVSAEEVATFFSPLSERADAEVHSAELELLRPTLAKEYGQRIHMTMAQLQEECRKRKLDVQGNTAELLQRLEENDKQKAAAK